MILRIKTGNIESIMIIYHAQESFDIFNEKISIKKKKR